MQSVEFDTVMIMVINNYLTYCMMGNVNKDIHILFQVDGDWLASQDPGADGADVHAAGGG